MLRAAAGNSQGIVYVGGRTFSSTSTSGTLTIPLTSLTGGIASSPATGDFVLVSVAIANTSSIIPKVLNTGFTSYFQGYQNDSNDTNLCVFYKVMGATPDTSCTTSAPTTAGNTTTATVQVFRKVHPTIPIGIGTSNFKDGSVLPSFLPIELGGTNMGISCIGAGAHIDGNDTYSSSDLNQFRTQGVNGTYDSTIGAGIKLSNPPGTISPAQFTFSGVNSSTYSCIGLIAPLSPITANTLPSIVSSAVVTNNTTTSVTVSTLSGISDGDYLLAFCTIDSPLTTITAPAGFTSLTSRTITNPGINIFIKTASSESGNYTFTFASGTELEDKQVIMTVVRGASSYVYRAISTASTGDLAGNKVVLGPTGVTAPGRTFAFLVDEGFNTEMSSKGVVLSSVVTADRRGSLYSTPQPAVSSYVFPINAPGNPDDATRYSTLHFMS